MAFPRFSYVPYNPVRRILRDDNISLVATTCSTYRRDIAKHIFTRTK